MDLEPQAFIWEIENRDAFKTAGTIFTKLSKMRRLPVQHNMKAATEERALPNGSVFYLPTLALDLQETLDVTDPEQETFANFLAWVRTTTTTSRVLGMKMPTRMMTQIQILLKHLWTLTKRTSCNEPSRRTGITPVYDGRS